MSPEQLAHAFERFYRADESGHIPGTGLCLALVNEIIHIHGGSAELQSQAGIGTTATLWLPVNETAAPSPNPTRPRATMEQKMRTEDVEVILTDEDVPRSWSTSDPDHVGGQAETDAAYRQMYRMVQDLHLVRRGSAKSPFANWKTPIAGPS